MKSYRDNPDGEENDAATRQAQREVFALKRMKHDLTETLSKVLDAIDKMHDENREWWTAEEEELFNKARAMTVEHTEP